MRFFSGKNKGVYFLKSQLEKKGWKCRFYNATFEFLDTVSILF